MTSTANHTCVYVNCGNIQRVERHLTFFKFPVRDAARAEIWKENCGNSTIAAMDLDGLKNKLICEKHFRTIDIMTNNKRKLVSRRAVPIRYAKAEPPQEPQVRTYSRIKPNPSTKPKICTAGEPSFSKKSHNLLHSFESPDSHESPTPLPPNDPLNQATVTTIKVEPSDTFVYPTMSSTYCHLMEEVNVNFVKVEPFGYPSPSSDNYSMEEAATTVGVRHVGVQCDSLPIEVKDMLSSDKHGLLRLKEEKEEDEDMAFFASLLPMMRKFNDEQRVRFRSRILELLEQNV
ncbi:hypothetical protein Trydic_g387 [Trypoxylus dichotomus]